MNDDEDEKAASLFAKIMEAQDKVNRQKISSGSFPNVKVDNRTGTWDHSYDWQREVDNTPYAEKLKLEKTGLLMEIDRLRRDASFARAELAAIKAQWSKEARDEFKKAATPDVARIVNDHDFLTSEVERLSQENEAKVAAPPAGFERHYDGEGRWALCVPQADGKCRAVSYAYEEWTYENDGDEFASDMAFQAWLRSLASEGESWETGRPPQ